MAKIAKVSPNGRAEDVEKLFLTTARVVEESNEPGQLAQKLTKIEGVLSTALFRT